METVLAVSFAGAVTAFFVWRDRKRAARPVARTVKTER